MVLSEKKKEKLRAKFKEKIEEYVCVSSPHLKKLVEDLINIIEET